MIRHYPQQLFLDGKDYRVEKILKEDFYSVNVLYGSQESPLRYVLKLSDFRFSLGVFLRPFASFMSWREYQIYKSVADIEGVPKLGPRYGKRGYFHAYVEGKTLFEIGKENGVAPDGLFADLRRIIDEIHSRRIFYVDLNKLGNIIAGEDGKTYLIDYQICLPFPKSGFFGRLLNPLFKILIRDDLYHLYKHKSRFKPELMNDAEWQMSKRSKLKSIVDNLLWKNFRAIKRKLYPHGSNEVIWYKWKKMHSELDEAPMEMP